VLVAGALATIANVVIYSHALDPPSPRRVLPEDADERPAEEVTPADPGLAPIELAAIRDDLERWPGPGRSPFLTRAEADAAGVVGSPARSVWEESLHARETNDESWKVEGTMWGPNRRIAWIEGAPRSEGDWLGDSQIARIEVDAVILRRGTEERVVRVARPRSIDVAAPVESPHSVEEEDRP
jgi:hypothetical protein